MPFWRRSPRPKRGGGGGFTLDEFVGDGDGRDATPLDLARDPAKWQKKLSGITSENTQRRDLALTAFTLIRGGDLFEAPKRKRVRTSQSVLDEFVGRQLQPQPNGVGKDVLDAAMEGLTSVVAGNPAVCLRMLLTKPIRVELIPKGRDFRQFGFPKHTHPRAAGIFFNRESDDTALIGLREELVLDKPWLMVHEMTHAVHLMGMTDKERKDIDTMLVPVYRSRRWVEEVVAIYAERAFGATYTKEELESRDLYGKTRREWTDRAVFSLFMEELLRP